VTLSGFDPSAGLARRCRSALFAGLAIAAIQGQSSFATSQRAPGSGCTAATERFAYPTYWLGPSYEGLKVSAVLLECRPKGSTITFLYGDCTPQGGGCGLPLDIQNYTPEMRNKEMYSMVRGPFGGPPGASPPPPPVIGVRGTDMTIEGVPATNYGGHLDVYHEETTVAVFSQVASKVDVAHDLVEAPAVPATLLRYGLYFDPECIDVVGYCQADRSPTSEDTEFILGILYFYGTWFGVPFLAGLVFGRVWTLAVPVVLSLLYYVAGSLGWIATGESWQYFIPYLTAGGIVATLIGIGIHAVISRKRRAA
jgi:hypothetical protein